MSDYAAAGATFLAAGICDVVKRWPVADRASCADIELGPVVYGVAVIAHQLAATQAGRSLTERLIRAAGP